MVESHSLEPHDLESHSRWISLAARAGLGAMWLYYAVPKLSYSSDALQFAVREYQIGPTGLADTFGTVQPFLELGLGLLVIVGLGTRLTAALSALLLLTVFEDVRCPYCDIFELGARDVYKQFVAAGEVKVEFHLVKLIDVNDQANGENASGSREGGSALACAQDAGLFDQYHDVLYDNQPSETTDPWADPSALIALANQVPGLDTPAFESCVANTTYGGWVDQNWADFNTLKLQGTPTIEIDGTALTAAQTFSATSKAGVTPTTSQDGQGANTAAIRSALQAAVTQAYGSSAPAPWNPTTSATTSTSAASPAPSAS